MQKIYKNKDLTLPPLIILWIITFFLISNKSIGQQTKYDTRPWDSILSLYKSGKISDTAYENRAFKLYFQYDKSPYLKELLETYREIGFSKKEYGKYRRNYYVLLANNTMWHENVGARIFYLEKAEEEEKTLPDYFPTLSSAQAEIVFLNGIKNYKLAIEKSKKQLAYIEKLAQLILTKNIYYTTIDNANIILKTTQDSYQKINDTSSSIKIFYLAKKIFEVVPKSIAKYNDMTVSMGRWNFLNMQYKQDKYLGNNKNAEANLRLIQKECERAKLLGFQWGEYGKLNVDVEMFNFFLEQKKLDSATKYLAYYNDDNFKINKSVVYDQNYFEYSSSLMKEKGDYKKAFNDLESAYKLKDSATNAKLSDNKNNLYAQAEAEFNRIELNKSEKQKRQRNMLIVAISAILGAGIFILYSLMQKNKRAAKKNIDNINFVSQLQIAELEEKNRMIKQEEQKKLGMDLHDTMASTIVAVKIKLEAELINNKDAEQTERLKTIRDLILNIYENTRNKSHELYHGIEGEFEISFSKRIKLIIDNAFSSNKFETEITVDDDALKNASIEIKIELLYIIQEAITNIIKHSQANKVSVLIYEDVSGLVLHIGDNGKGFNAKLLKNGIGLSSIKDRAAIVNGTVDITSGNKGTEINVTIPLGI